MYDLDERDIEMRQFYEAPKKLFLATLKDGIAFMGLKTEVNESCTTRGDQGGKSAIAICPPHCPIHLLCTLHSLHQPRNSNPQHFITTSLADQRSEPQLHFPKSHQSRSQSPNSRTLTPRSINPKAQALPSPSTLYTFFQSR